MRTGKRLGVGMICALLLAAAPAGTRAQNGQNDPFTAARRRARETSCLSNVKQVALAAMMFLQDHDEKFALKTATYQKSLMPYVKNETIFRCPEDRLGKGGSYAFNKNLQGVSLAKINRPDETVMIYEGAGQTLRFRHDGKASVSFADGHVKLVTRDRAKTLRWTP